MVYGVSTTLQVDPRQGIDQPVGGRSAQLPYKTLTAALLACQGKVLIRLAAGTYSQATGERFPLVLGAGVIVLGQESNQGQGVVITGGGPLPDGGITSLTLVLEGQAQLRGVTVQNPQGSGILVRSAEPMIRACHLCQIGQIGLLVTAQAQPLILNNHLESISGTGLSFTGQAKGEVKNCFIQDCGLGLQVGEAAAPLLLANQLTGNQIGVQISGQANPVLRQNRLYQNRHIGLDVLNQAQPDLGQPTDPGGNTLRANGQIDLRNQSSTELLAVGNDLLPQTTSGAVTLAPSQQPDPAAVPEPLLDATGAGDGEPADVPETTAVRVPAPVVTPGGPSYFIDLKEHWAAPYIAALVDRNLVKGFADGTYRPDQPINRAQFAALVANSYKTVPLVRAKVAFTDVPPDFWAYGAIDRAQQQGFVGGYPDQSYRPEQPITRAQAMVAVATGLLLPGAGASVLGLYSDRAQIPSYAINALAAATQAGLVVNYPDPAHLRPQEPITRAEVAALIYQGLVAWNLAPRLALTPSPLHSLVQGTFADIRGHWAEDFIQGLLNANLVQGQRDGCFYPDQAISRSQFAALINSAFRPPVRRPPVNFRDVPSTYWGARAIQSAYQGNFLSGFPDQCFGPDSSMVRVQLWVALVNGLAGLANQPPPLSLLEQFSDRASLPSYALEAVARATRLRFIVNAPQLSQLNPNRIATRADAAAAIYQALVWQKQLPTLASPYLVSPPP